VTIHKERTLRINDIENHDWNALSIAFLPNYKLVHFFELEDCWFNQNWEVGESQGKIKTLSLHKQRTLRFSDNENHDWNRVIDSRSSHFQIRTVFWALNLHVRCQVFPLTDKDYSWAWRLFLISKFGKIKKRSIHKQRTPPFNDIENHNWNYVIDSRPFHLQIRTIFIAWSLLLQSKLGSWRIPRKNKKYSHLKKELCASTILKIRTEFALSILGIFFYRWGQFLELAQCWCNQDW